MQDDMPYICHLYVKQWLRNLMYTVVFCSSYGVGVTKPIAAIPLLSEFFQNNQSTIFVFNILLIFDRCRRSIAAETHVKYECDFKKLTYNFAIYQIPIAENFTNGALVTTNTSQVRTNDTIVSRPPIFGNVWYNTDGGWLWLSRQLPLFATHSICIAYCWRDA